jgi:serine/threonine-protein kinase
VWNGTSPGGSGAALAATPPPRNCFVTYAVLSDTGRKFKAGLLVTNNSSAPIADWDLRFVMPGDQKVSSKGAVKVKQKGHDVTAASAKAIEPLRSVQVNLNGGYRESNAVPMLFALDGQLCEVLVSAKPGSPARLVPNSPTTVINPSGFPEPGPSAVGVPTLSTNPDGVVVTRTADPTATRTTGPTETATPLETETVPPELPPGPPVVTAGPTTPPAPPPPLPLPDPGDDEEEEEEGLLGTIGSVLEDLTGS